MIADPTFDRLDELHAVLAELKQRCDAHQSELESAGATAPAPLAPQQLRDWAYEQSTRLDESAVQAEVDMADHQLVECFVERIEVDPDTGTGVIALQADLQSALASAPVV